MVEKRRHVLVSSPDRGAPLPVTESSNALALSLAAWIAAWAPLAACLLRFSSSSIIGISHVHLLYDKISLTFIVIKIWQRLAIFPDSNLFHPPLLFLLQIYALCSFGFLGLNLLSDEMRVKFGLGKKEIEFAGLTLGFSGLFFSLGTLESFTFSLFTSNNFVFLVLPPKCCKLYG